MATKKKSPGSEKTSKKKKTAAKKRPVSKNSSKKKSSQSVSGKKTRVNEGKKKITVKKVAVNAGKNKKEKKKNYSARSSARKKISRILLSGMMDVSRMEQLHGEMKISLETKSPVVIDTAKLERISAPALQLLYAFIRKAKELDVEVTWKSLNDDLVCSAKTLGMDKQLGLY